MILTYQAEKQLEDTGTENSPFRMAKVISYTSNAAVVQFDGESAASTKSYKRIYGTTITVGDRVLCAKVAGSYVVIGACR